MSGNFYPNWKLEIGNWKLEIGNWKLNYWLVGLLLASASALLRFWALSQTPYGNGWDSYFYLVQLKSIEETGRMHSPDASLIYPYFRLFYWISGDYIEGMKVGTAVLCGLWTGVAGWLVHTVPTGRKWGHPPFHSAEGPGLNAGKATIAAWSLFSPHLTWFAAQYPKNLLGMVLLVAFMGSLSRRGCFGFSIPGKPWVLPVLLLVANYFSHRFTFVLAVIYLIFWLIAGSKDALFKIVFSRKNLLRLGVAFGLLLAASRIFPGMFHFADFGRLQGAFTGLPQFAPWSFVSQFGTERISGWWLAEVILVTGCWLLVAGYWMLAPSKRTTHPSPLTTYHSLLATHHSPLTTHHSPIPNPPSLIPHPPSPLPLLALCTLLLFPFLKWDFTGAAWRFFLVFVLLTPLLVIDFQFDKWRRSGLIFAAFLLCCSCFSWKSYEPKMHDPDYARFAAITARSQQALEGKNVDLLIAHNALAEFFTFTTGTDAMPWLPEYAVDSSRLWRIATGVHLPTLRFYAGEQDAASITTLGYRYFLLPEYVWQGAVRKAKVENDEDFLAEALAWKNPSKMRPGWLLRRKRGY